MWEVLQRMYQYVFGGHSRINDHEEDYRELDDHDFDSPDFSVSLKKLPSSVVRDLRPGCGERVRACCPNFFISTGRLTPIGIFSLLCFAMLSFAIGVPIGLLFDKRCEKQRWQMGVKINAMIDSVNVSYTASGFGGDEDLLLFRPASLGTRLTLLNQTDVSCHWIEAFSNDQGVLMPGQLNASSVALLASKGEPVPGGSLAQMFAFNCNDSSIIEVKSELDLSITSDVVSADSKAFSRLRGTETGSASGALGDLCNGGAATLYVSAWTNFAVGAVAHQRAAIDLVAVG